MNFTIQVSLPLQMIDTKYGQNWPSTLREGAENVQMLTHGG